MTDEQKPVAWMYALEYGDTVADRKVSLNQLNYPFGVCGADYLRENSDGMSYVRKTPLYAQPVFVSNQNPVAWTTLEELQDLQNYTHSSMWGEKVWPDEVDYIPLYTQPTPAVVRQLVEALRLAQSMMHGMEQNYGNLWVIDETPESLDLIERKIAAALAAAKEAGLW